jgi:hypothetical protein
MNDKGKTPYQVTKSDMRVLGGFFTMAGLVWTGFLPREYFGPTGIPQWWIGIPICAFALFILLNAKSASQRRQTGESGNTEELSKREQARSLTG